MSTDLNLVKVSDARISKCTPKSHFAVMKGAQNVTQMEYSSQSATSNSNIVFTVQLPSVDTIMDRRIMIKSKMSIEVELTRPKAGLTGLEAFNHTVALAAFPLNQGIVSCTATLNSASISSNISDVLASLLKLQDVDELRGYNSLTPTLLDIVQKYDNATLVPNLNVLAGYSNSIHNAHQIPRGAYGPISINKATTNSAAADIETYIVTYEVTEPLMMSPFLSSSSAENSCGIYGIQTFNLSLNMGNKNRVIRSVLADGNSSFIKSVKNIQYTESRLQLTFLTPQSSDLLAARNVVPYSKLEKFILSGGSSVANTTSSIMSGTITMNSIPDYLIVQVRKAFNEQLPSDSDTFLPIKSITINFNNKSGLLSNAKPQDLYRMSVANGCQTNFLEFSGKAQSTNFTINAATLQNNSTLLLAGAPLVLAFGKDIECDDFVAAGVLGQFSLSYTVTYENNSGTAFNVEVLTILSHSGIIVNENGSSQTFVGVLSRGDVLDATAQEESFSEGDVKRLVGSGFFDSLKSGLSKLAEYAKPVVKFANQNILSKIPNPKAQLLSQGLSSLGMGMSGGVHKNRLK
jgi:hypothetical protein